MVFRKGRRLPENLHFFYDGSELEIVNKFVYLGVTLVVVRFMQHEMISQGKH